MKKSDFAQQFPTVWGAQAQTSYLQFPIPNTSSDDGRASLTVGFPPGNFAPPEAGGSFMYGQDLNGVLRMLATSAQNYESGVVPPFSASFATSVGGYPLGCLVSDPSTTGAYWVSTTDNNLTTPGADGAAWVSLFDAYFTKNQSDVRYLQPASLNPYYTGLQSDAKYCPLIGFTTTGDFGAKGIAPFSTDTSKTSNGLVLSGQNGNTVSLRQNEVIGSYIQAALQVNGYNNTNAYFSFRVDGSIWSGSDQISTRAYANGTVAVGGNNWFWMKLPNGMLIQGGVATYNSSDGATGTAVTLPTTFGSSFIYSGGNDIGSAANSATVMRVNSSTIRILGREVTTGTFQNTTINYLCIGTAP